ncbi:MAG: response regulator [Mariprofundus sp.]|nr:response regulator [Mariprofundus sp.]
MPTPLTALPSIVRNLSLQAKLTVIVLIATLIPIMIIATYSYEKASTSYAKAAELLDSARLKEAKSTIDHALNQVPHDLDFLAQFHDLKRYLLWHAIGADGEANQWLRSTINGFYSFMQSNDQYMQLRVIDTKGWEVIRINRDNNGAVSISEKKDLQRQNESDYFIQTMQLPAHKYYVSRLNLNREHGKVQQPYTPVIRYALPMIDKNGTRHGIIIINLFASTFLNQVNHLDDVSQENNNNGFYIVNQDSFFLSHPNQAKTFGFDRNHIANLIIEHPQLWDAIQDEQTGHLITAQRAYFFDKVYPLAQNKDLYWHVIHTVPRDVYLAELSTFQQIFFAIILFLIISIVLLSRPLIRMLIKPVLLVTANMQRLERGEINLRPITYNAKDELRDMVDASNGMGARIAGAIKQANTIAQGDFRSEITPLSRKDELGIALQSMTTTLQNVADIAEAVAKGHLDKDISISNDHDRLSLSINKMISTMRKTVTQANKIAHGDFRNDFEPSSDKDTLGIALKDMTLTLRHVSQIASTLATGDYNIDIEVKGEFDQLGRSILHMTRVLKSNAEDNQQQDWLKTNLANTAKSMQNQTDTQTLANNIMQLLPHLLNASHGAFYIMQHYNSEVELVLESSYAFKQRKNISHRFKPGEGLIGQCALQQQSILLTHVPDDYIKIQSGLGESTPKQIIIVPLLAENKLMGVIELATTAEFSDIQKEFLEQVSDSIGIGIYTLQSSQRTHQLLEESQSMTEELQAQEEELRTSNSTLEARAKELEESEERLQSQQEELRLNNDQLVAKNVMVEAQKTEIKASAESLALQAERLRQASQYKSDFLSNMSHELRTPLNSLLILSDMLAKNKDGNLSKKQVEFASTIHASGYDLLELINSILDLAKIEAGKMNLDPHRFPLLDISDSMQRGFAHVANNKSVIFHIEQAYQLPEMMFQDAMRIKQVLKNLLSNALKFTHEGEVTLRLERVDKNQISFSVHDSGVGIAAEKLHDIFEAFQQEDGSTSRKYGGTGLGLSICRELAKLLGGHITVQSELGKGSTFALIIPIECSKEKQHDDEADTVISLPQALHHQDQAEHINNIEDRSEDLVDLEHIPNLLADDRDQINAKDHSVLIVEDDATFASIQQGLVREHGFKAINALRGDHALRLAQQYNPDAILLDLQLPVLDGMSLLDRLKRHPELRHIPVHVISCMDKHAEKRVLQAGAISFIHKPAQKDELDQMLDRISDFIERDIRRLLIVEDDDKQRQAMSALLEANDVHIVTAKSGAEVMQILKAEHVDCMILDLSLPDMSGEDILDHINRAGTAINQGHVLPIIVHTGKDLSEAEVEKLQGMAKSIIVKGSYSPERLLAETSLFLHQIEGDLSAGKQQKIDKSRELDIDIAGKTVLLVDDDIRNIYSLSSYLEGHDLVVHTARNGVEALNELAKHSDEISVILMDIMMPEMDGYEAMQKIRAIDEHKNLPIIALTAKAMKGDRERCIASGASDYICKPINTDKLISLMRVWLHE